LPGNGYNAPMKIAVIGSGPRPDAIARLLAGGGFVLARSDGEYPAPYEAATGCGVVLFAESRDKIEDLVVKIGRLLPSTVVIDAMEGGSLPPDESAAELLARLLDSHRVVRASIALPVPNANVLLAGDDADAVSVAEEIFRTCGCVTTERGTLAHAAEIEAPRTGVMA